MTSALNQLRLLQLADSALPVGAAAHSYGLETLVEAKLLATDQLASFLNDYLSEVGALEGSFCRAAYRLQLETDLDRFAVSWLELNTQLSALKPARESRAASALLGRRLLRLLLELETLPPIEPVGGGSRLEEALRLATQAGTDIHYSLAFGLAGGALNLDEEATVLAYLQQSLAGLISACQRLLPLGQSAAARHLWDLKPAMIAAAQRSRESDLSDAPLPCFIPLVEVGSMAHATLHTRLFMS